ncbi:hypothetical protein PR202_ga25622 [Eleusine coracana subsp. coracana]|uniref:NYN domain-containing protein n=1 Tax=Eleusine coracana subsp. coracana TaxID=191504 RepID=A0AAV5DC60_ELECO|nr:hypothetical protein PR202_ga25622 [Eleusine coracana subsp. coracana]
MGECSPSAAKTSVWWDIDKCAVPRGRGDPHRIAYNIIGALAAAGYAGPVSIAAYGDAARVAPPILHALSATGICVTHVPAGSKDTSDKRMLVDMLFWAFDNPPPGNFLLISGDRDFSDLLYRLRMKRYNILLVRPSNASSQILAAAAKTVARQILIIQIHQSVRITRFSWGMVRDENVASNQCRLKPLQKYVKKATGASGPTENQDRVESVGGVSESFVGSTGSQLDQSSVPSSSSSSCNSNEGVLKPNLSNSGPLKCSQNKILLECVKGDENVKESNQCRSKSLQRYVKKVTGASSPTENQDQVEPVGVSKGFIGSTSSELDQSSVPLSLSSSCHLNDGANTSVLLETPALSKSSAQEHVLSTQPQQVEATHRSILGETPSTSTKCVARNGTLDFGGSKRHYNQTCQHHNELPSEFRIGDNNGKVSSRYRVKPLQKYVKKTNTTFCSASNKVDSVQVPGCPKVNIKSEADGSSVSSSPPLSSSEILKAAKAENSGQPGSSTPSHSSIKKSIASAQMHQVRASNRYIFVKKPSISVEHASTNGAHGFNVSTVHCHPISQQSKSSEAQNKIHPHSNLRGNSGKSGNGYKLNQQQMYVKKVDVSSASTSNVMAPVCEFPDNPSGSTLSHPSQSVSASSSSETLHTAKLNQSPPIIDNLHEDCSGFIFGKNGTSVQCTSQNGTSAFGVDNGHCHPTYLQSQSSLLPEQNISSIPHPHDVFGHSHSMNSQLGSYAQPSAVSNNVFSTQIQAFPSGSTFQGLDDICHGISRLNISECSRGTVEVKPVFQGKPVSDTAMEMTSISGHSKKLCETRSYFHYGSDTSCFLNQSNNSQTGQPSSDYTCRNLHPPVLTSEINPGQHGERPRYVSNCPDPEGTIGHILHALDILKAEKIFPTESNIADCIHYGEMNLTGFDVMKALEFAIQHQAVVMKKLLNDMPLFVPKDESLWKCVNVTNSKAKNPIDALDTVQKYISSVNGHSAVKNSQSRYQAATILKESCLQQYALGDVLQVLHIIIVRKKWLVPHSSGWQPLSLNTTGVIAPTDATGKA